MALDPKTMAATALHRFGFGPRAGSIASVAADPRGAVLAELDRPGAGRITDSDLLTTGEAARAAFDFRQERKAQRLAARSERETTQAEEKRAADAAKTAPNANMAQAEMKQGDGAPAEAMQAAPAKANPGPGIPQQIYLEEAKVRFDSALNAEIGLIDRLTWFWSNHFCVSADKGQVRPLCGAYEREAIRANVLGKFPDMLLAVESHPAMLLYLDNAGSIGPNSIAGQRRGKGINENLAREIMELHTLGVKGGYSQEDVTNFAKVITGWTFRPLRQDPQHGGEFFFNERMHEPGTQSVLGRNYGEGGYEQGKTVLLMLAHHPATAKHISTKLVRHFIADDPPPALVDRLTKRFLETGGDLKEVTKTLVSAPESWDAPRSKLKRPGNGFAIEIAAGPNDIVTISNLLLSVGPSGVGALKFTSGGQIQLSNNVYRGNDTTTGPVVALYPNNPGTTQAQVYFSHSDVGFNNNNPNAGAVEVKPSGNTSLKADFNHVELHNASYGIRTDGSLLLSPTANVTTTVSEAEFFSFPNAAVNAFSTSGTGTVNAVSDFTRILNSGVALKANGPQSFVILANNTVGGNTIGVQQLNGANVITSHNTRSPATVRATIKTSTA